MRTQKYPTNMHAILCVEPYQLFTYGDETQCFYVTLQGYVHECLKNGKISHLDNSASTRRICQLVNNPQKINIIPDFTEEQLRKLSALYDFGMRYLIHVNTDKQYNMLYATVKMPTWAEKNGWLWCGEFIMIDNSCLNDLNKSYSKAPLEIETILIEYRGEQKSENEASNE